MARPDKTTAVAELAEDFRTANATVLTEYRGLSVTSMKELRRALGSTTMGPGIAIDPNLVREPSAN